MIWFTFKLNFFFGALVLLFCAKDLVESAKLNLEERLVRESYGAEYETYRANVARWLPRLTPWRAL